MVSVYYQNVNGIRSKLTQFYMNVLNSNFDIVCLTETNLNNSVFDGEIIDDRYNVYRRDRAETHSKKQEGGGVLIAIHKRFKVIRQTHWDSGFEDIWITVMHEKNCVPNINICVCYLPPDMNYSDIDYFYSHCQNIILNEVPDDYFLLVGDFNTPNIQWPSLTSSYFYRTTLTHIPNKKSDSLIELVTTCGLKQANMILNTNKRILDLVLSNLETVTVNETTELSLLDRYHPSILINIPQYSLSKSLKQNPRKRLNFFKCDLNKVKYELNLTDWSEILNHDDVNVCCEIFYSTLFAIINKYTPVTNVKHHRYPIWYNKSLIKCNEEKNKYHKLFKKFKNPRDYDVFSLLRKRCKRLAVDCYNNYVSSIENSLNKNIKIFWSYVNNRRVYGSNTSLPQAMKFGETIATSGLRISELFSQYFSSVYEKDTTANFSYTFDEHMYFKDRISNTLSSIVLDEGEVFLKLKLLNISKGAGPDRIPPYFVRSCRNELVSPLCKLFNKSLASGVFPNLWKTAYIIPIHKSGDKSRCENYRPISILSCFAKIFESSVYMYLYNHFKPLISEKQHGFLKNKSTISNLLVYKDFLCKSFAAGGQTDSVYTDFSKAFDKVNHRILLHKLVSYGIHGNLFRWISSYLNKRSQLVALKGFLSSPVTVTSGVPQGSNLGPLLFNIFVNDLTEYLVCNHLLYADDLKIFHNISSPADCSLLQQDLDTLVKWCNSNHMFLNSSKCFVISFTNKRNKIINNYFLNNSVLNRSVVAKDLGIIFDEKLSFRSHYQYITSKANQLLGFVLRSSKDFKNPHSVLYLFFSLVRSLLEYATPIWSPYYKVHIDDIERVQKKCLRILAYRLKPGRNNLNYEHRLAQFKIDSLSLRRKYFDLIYLYKITHYIINSSELISQISFNTRYTAR